MEQTFDDLYKERKVNGSRSGFIIGAIILSLILFTWGGLFLEEIYCLRGIRCD